MACSEEVDWGQPKEEQQSDAEQTDAIIHRTSAKRKKNEEEDLDPYTYETYSESFDETDMDRSVTSRDKLQRRKSCHRRGNEKPDSSQVIAASSKYKARPVKQDSSQVIAASSKCKARPVKATESQQSSSSCTGGRSDAMRARRVLLRPNVQSQIADTEAYRKTTGPPMGLFMGQFWQYVVLRSYFDHIDNTDSTGSPDIVSPRAWSTHSLLLDYEVWDYIGIPCDVFGKLIGRGTEANAILDTLYEGPELKLHQHMWNIMTTDKEGKDKENKYVEWCRQVDDLCHDFRDYYGNATEQTLWPKVQQCSDWYYNWLLPHMLRNETTLEQQRQSKYQYQAGGFITSEQNSWARTVLRKNLGDYRTVYFIFHHGLPQLLQSPHRVRLPECEFADIFSEFVKWHAALLMSLGEHKETYMNAVAEYRSRERQVEAAAIVRQRIIDGFRTLKGMRSGEGLPQPSRQLLRDIVGEQCKPTSSSATRPKAEPFVGDRWKPM